MEYNVSVKETLERRLTVNASTEEEALKIVKEKYEDEEIVLDYNDFVEVVFERLEDN